MVEVIFNYKAIETKIQSDENDKMKDIVNKFIVKSQKQKSIIIFLYNGNKINEELTFKEQANELDNTRKKMNLLVYDNDDNNNNERKLIKSQDIICLECQENILINIKDYRINLYQCKNNHTKNNILLEEYENNQRIDISEIKCNKCKDKNMKETYNNEFYICNTCNMNLCPLCKSSHNNNHNIIKYNDKNYICNKHNDTFIKYCEECKENLCILCENNHNNHNIYLGEMVTNKNDLLKENEELRKIIDKFKKN